MNARSKLNTAAVNGALIIAGLIGWVFGSWLVFGIVAALLVTSALHSGSIRTNPTRRR